MKSGDYVPQKGDCVWLEFDPQKGHEQRGKRPAMIVSSKLYNEKTSLCLCVPITSKIKGYPFEVKLPNTLPIAGVILSDQVKSLDFTARHAMFIASAPPEVVQQVEEYICLLVK